MKICNNILAAICVAVLFVGCDKGFDNKDIRPLPPVVEDNYIQFEAEIGTRGKIIDEIPEKIGIYGYQYSTSNTWAGYRASAKPNVFERAPEVAENSSGFYSYEDQKPWTGNRYTFFAFAPYDNSNITYSGKNEENSPYVDYTVSRSDHSKHVDILTAAHYLATTSTNTIIFQLAHRTALVEVGVLNAYEYNYVVDGVTYTEPITIEITQLNLEFDNLHYSSARIYLDELNMSMNKHKDGNITASYDIVNSGSVSFPFNTTSEVQYIGNNAAMFFIPQTERDLTVRATGTFKKKRSNGEYLVNEDTKSPLRGTTDFAIDKNVAFDASLQAKYRHDVVLSFTSAAVSINVVTSAAWDNHTEDGIRHEFE